MRPRCPRNHSMAFMAQVLLSDVPELTGNAGLLSFHYCVGCQDAGDMSFGASDTSNRGYSVVMFTDLDRVGDGLGQTVPSPLPSHSVSFSDVIEVPAMEDLAEEELGALPPDYPAGDDDFDEQVWPGVVHVARSKLGGWPHWQQSAEWPECVHGSRMVFVGQLDFELGENAGLAGGGYAYLFVCPSSCPVRCGELVIQTT